MSLSGFPVRLGLGLYLTLAVVITGPAARALADEADAPASVPALRGLRDLTEYERFELAHLPWAGDPDPAQLKHLRQAWAAMNVGDDETARSIVEKDADAGDANAQYLMGRVLLDRNGGSEHVDEAVALFTKAAAQGQPTAAFRLGRLREFGIGKSPVDLPEAIYWYRMSDALGHPEAASKLCWFFHRGIGAPRDERQALIYCQRAADRGSAWAMNHLGFMYDWGIAVPRDRQKAFDRIMKAAVAGYPEGERLIALRYLRGIGVDPNPVEAMEWLSRAAAQNDVAALVELGAVYRDGLAGTVDLPKAAMYFREAADRGSSAARCEYAAALEEGRGVNKDLVQAYLWYSLAALGGDAKAEGPLARLKVTLNSDELERATRLAEAARTRKPGE